MIFVKVLLAFHACHRKKGCVNVPYEEQDIFFCVNFSELLSSIVQKVRCSFVRNLVNFGCILQSKFNPVNFGKHRMVNKHVTISKLETSEVTGIRIQISFAST